MTPWSLHLHFCLCLCLFHVFVAVSGEKDCSLLPTNSASTYREHVRGYGTVVRSCPPGTSFSVESCHCSIFLNKGTSTNAPADGVRLIIPGQSINDQFSEPNQQTNIGHSSSTGGKNPDRGNIIGGDVVKSRVPNTRTLEEERRAVGAVGAVGALFTAPDPINQQKELQGGSFDLLQKLSSGSNVDLEYLLSTLVRNYIKKLKGQRKDALLHHEKPSLSQKENADNEVQSLFYQNQGVASEALSSIFQGQGVANEAQSPILQKYGVADDAQSSLFQMPDVTNQAESPFFQEQEGFNEVQKLNSRKVVPESNLRPEIRHPTRVQAKSSARITNQAMLPSDFQSGMISNDQPPEDPFANHPLFPELA